MRVPLVAELNSPNPNMFYAGSDEEIIYIYIYTIHNML